MKKTDQFIVTSIFVLCFQWVSQGQSLDSLFSLAVDNNTELKALESEYEAILMRQDQVSQLPNPQFGVGTPLLRPETRLGPQVMMVSVSQMFPWFGTFDTKKDVVIQMSKAKYEELTAIKLVLIYTIKSAYYQLIFLEEKEKVYRENLENYKVIESVALAKVEAGQSSLSDVLRIQIKIDALDTQLQKIANNKTVLFAEINATINAPLEQEITIVDPIDSDLINYNLEAYKSNIEKNHPIIKKLDYQIAASNSKIAVNESLNKPTIGLGVDYSLVNPRIDADPLNNGRDILVPKVMVSIPLYRKSVKAVRNEEKLHQEALGYQKESLTNNMLRRVISYQSDFDNAQLDYEVAQLQLEKITSAYSIILASYSADGKKFEELLTTQNEITALKLKLHASSLEMGLAKAKIERLTNF